MTNSTNNVSPVADKPDKPAGEVSYEKRSISFLTLNSDKTVQQVVRTSSQEWLESPAGGVYRKPIERLGDEHARCTTLVKFLPDKMFPQHAHGGGEEFFVTDGAWRDHFGKKIFPKYTYIRNYLGSKHSPQIGDEGVTIMVKLRQMSEDIPEPEHESWDARPPTSEDQRGWQQVQNGSQTFYRKELYTSRYEKVSVEYYPVDYQGAFSVEVPQHGKEVFVVDGCYVDELGEHDKYSWARYVAAKSHTAQIKGAGELYLYVKEGHLASPEVGLEKTKYDE